MLDRFWAQSLRNEQISHNPIVILWNARAHHTCVVSRMPEGHGARFITALIQVQQRFSSYFQFYRHL